MKYTFETDDPQEAQALISTGVAWFALRQIDQLVRNQLKHGSELTHENKLEEVREIALNALGEIE